MLDPFKKVSIESLPTEEQARILREAEILKEDMDNMVMPNANSAPSVNAPAPILEPAPEPEPVEEEPAGNQAPIVKEIVDAVTAAAPAPAVPAPAPAPAPVPEVAEEVPVPVPAPRMFPDIYAAATQSFSDLRAMDALEKSELQVLQEDLAFHQANLTSINERADNLLSNAETEAADMRALALDNVRDIEAAIAAKVVRISDIELETDDSIEALIGVLKGRLDRRRAARAE